MKARKAWAAKRADGRPAAREDGSAVVWTLLGTWLVWLFVLLAISIAGGFAARQHARAAADLGALSAFSAGDPGAGCSAARRIAGANKARLVRCTPEADGTYVVTAAADLPGLLRALPDAQATARAGRA